jgi:hypothetical protein
MRSKNLLVLMSVLVIVGASGYFIFRPDRLNVPAPFVGQGAPPSVATTTSQVQIEFILKLAALQQALNHKAPKQFNGTTHDPTNWLSEDTLNWHLTLGEISLTPQNGSLGFSAPFSGQATIRGKVGVKQRNSGLLGRIESIFNKSTRETAKFGGVLRGTLKPIFRPDWTIDPQLTVAIELNKAEATLFGKAIKVSFRGEVEGNVREKASKFAAALTERMKTDNAIRAEVEKGWTALHLVTPVYQSPPIWVSLTPKTLGASSPEVTADDLILRVAASIHAGVQVSENQPTSSAVELPELSAVSDPGGAFLLAIPVALELKSFHAVSPEQLRLPDTFDTPAGKVHVKRLFLLGDAGTLYVGAEITARTSWLDSVSGTIYLAGKPVLDEEGNTLRIEDLKYDVRTSNELVKAANFLLHPTIVAELRKLAVFNIKSSKEELMGLANTEIAKLVAELPSGIELDFNVKNVGIAELIVDKGWLVAVATADGPATVRVTGLDEVLGDATVDVPAAGAAPAAAAQATR